MSPKGNKADFDAISKKLRGDQVQIGGTGRFMDQTTSKALFRDVSGPSKSLNTGMDPFIAGNIRGSHFDIGKGPLGS